MLKHNTKKTFLIMIVNMAFYLAFLIMTLYAALVSKEGRAILFAVFGFLAFLLGVYREYVRLKHGEARWYLDEKLDADEAKKRYDELMEKDILKVYEDERPLWEAMVANEKKQAKKVLNLIDMHPKQFSSNNEMKLWRYYYEARAGLFLGRTKRVADACEGYQNMKRKSDRIQEAEMEGMKELVYDHRDSAYECFLKVKREKLTSREKKFVLENLIKLAPLKEKEPYERELQELMEKVRES